MNPDPRHHDAHDQDLQLPGRGQVGEPGHVGDFGVQGGPQLACVHYPAQVTHTTTDRRTKERCKGESNADNDQSKLRIEMLEDTQLLFPLIVR